MKDSPTRNLIGEIGYTIFIIFVIIGVISFITRGCYVL